LAQIQYEKPTKNAYIECFNLIFHEDILDTHVFQTLDLVHYLVEP
jgi:hypothetical protein